MQTKVARGAVATFVSERIAFHSCLARLETGDTGVYPLVFQYVVFQYVVFQCISEPIRILAAISEQPIYPSHATGQRLCPDVVNDLTRGGE